MLSPGRIYPGAVMAITANFAAEDESAIDPTTVTFKTFSPCGVIASYVYGTDSEVIRTGIGVYRAEFSADRAGRWHYRWETTGTGSTTASEGVLTVQVSPFYDDCCSDYGAYH